MEQSNITEFLANNKEKYEVISSFQYQINHISKESYQSTVQYIRENSEILFKNKENSLMFFYCLNHFSLYNYKQLELIFDIANEFQNEMRKNDITDTDMVAICSHFLNAINYLFYIKVISIESIIRQSRKRPILFINFYPEIEQYDPEYAQKRSKWLPKEIKNKKDELLQFFEFVKSNPEQHIKYRNENYHPSKLHKSIRDDDIDTFQELLSQNNYTVNHIIKHSFYERTSTCDADVSLIQIAAVYGSLKVFKFLWMQNDIFLNENLQFYSYSGRNFEIIHICEEKCPFLNAIDYAISTHQNELVDYFLDNFEDEMITDDALQKVEDDENPFKKLSKESLQMSLLSLNYDIILPSLKKIVYIINSIESQKDDIYAWFFGQTKSMIEYCFFDLDLFKFLFNLNRERYSDYILNINKYSNAIFSGAYDAFKYMIDQVDIETCYEKFGNFLSADSYAASIILDLIKKNDTYLDDLKKSFNSELIFKALENYDEDVVVKMIEMFDLLNNEKLMEDFVKKSIEYLSPKMIISLCKKLSPVLEKCKLVNLADFYTKFIMNDEFISQLNEIKNKQ